VCSWAGVCVRWARQWGVCCGRDRPPQPSAAASGESQEVNLARLLQLELLPLQLLRMHPWVPWHFLAPRLVPPFLPLGCGGIRSGDLMLKRHVVRHSGGVASDAHGPSKMPSCAPSAPRVPGISPPGTATSVTLDPARARRAGPWGRYFFCLPSPWATARGRRSHNIALVASLSSLCLLLLSL
jgi:hypothetical protein